MITADLSSSFRSFTDAAGAFFSHLADVRWLPFALALLMLTAMQLSRARAWHNVLRAAYPGTPISFVRVSASYLAGAGINAIIPARAGDVTKIFLVKKQIPHSSYPAVTSSFFVQSVFDTTAGVLVLLYAVTQGLLPSPPELPDLPAFEIAFWAENPQLLIFTVTVLGVGSLIAFALLARRAELFWARIKQGVDGAQRAAPLPAPGGGLAGDRVALPLRGLLVLPRGVSDRGLDPQRDAGDERPGDRHHHPLHPRGSGAQQALLVATLEGPSRSAVLSFSVGTQIAMAAWSVVLGFGAIILVFGTTDWRGLIRDAESERRGGAGGRAGARDRSARPARVAAAHPPLPGRPLARREVVVVAPGQRLQRHQVGVVAEQHPHAGRGHDLATIGAPDDPLPAECRSVEPIGDADAAAARRRSETSVKAVVRRPEEVRWDPAGPGSGTAQLSRRQRRKSTGTRGSPEGPGSADGGGASARTNLASGQP